MRLTLRVGLVAWLAASASLAAGCGADLPDGPSTGRSVATSPAPSGAPSSNVAPERWACSVDADCTNSCALGAVSSAWYAAAKVDECEDGCANVLAEPPRCIDGGCVAFSQPPEGGAAKKNDWCTRKVK
ncbi:MAG: hypothetical protein HOV80_05965 [Polyangiaceae bacterium]|nr:hypothetical protein [Polyangiaceae bacterium]